MDSNVIIGVEIHIDDDLIFKDARFGAVPFSRPGKFPGWLNYINGQIEQYQKRLIYTNEAQDDT